MAALALTVSVVLYSSAVGAESVAKHKAAAYLSDKLAGCWTIPADGGPVVTRIQISFNRDGSLAGSPRILNPAKALQDKKFNDSAVRSIVRCAPFTGLAIYADSYEVWREMVITFDPGDMLSSAQPK